MSEQDAVAADISTGSAGSATAPSHAGDRPRSLGRDAWDDLRKRPVVLVSVAIILVLVVMAIAPGLFTNADPRLQNLRVARDGPSGAAWFGNDTLGRDVYSRTIHGARASIVVGIISALVVAGIGTMFGMLAGFYGRLTDTLVSRGTDIVFGIPFLLGAIIVLVSFPAPRGAGFWGPVIKVVLAFALLAWPAVTRLMRSAVLQVKEADYVSAARALGASGPRILRTHVLPNAIQPVIVYSTIALGVIIGAEAALSYLGIGLQTPVISWGIAIADAQDFVRSAPHMLLFPGLFLSVTVLAFIMLGDAVRDALDPKLR